MNIARKLQLRASLIAVMIFSFPAVSMAQDNRPAELAKANRDLNRVYLKVAEKLSGKDRVKFRNAQRAWIVMRDLDCQWAFRLQALDCAIDRTENRIAEIEQTFFVDSKGEYVSIETEKD
ncbi:MAG: lysozyme inhibitor LprI family protein [Pseudomonadota bacterium]